MGRSCLTEIPGSLTASVRLELAAQLRVQNYCCVFYLDLTKADVVVVDTVKRTVIPKSMNHHGQIIYIKYWVPSPCAKSNFSMHRLTEGEAARCITLAPTNSQQRTAETKIRIDDNTGTLVENPSEPLMREAARPADPIEQQRMQKKFMEHTGFSSEAADFFFENGKGVTVNLVESTNPNGLMVEAHHAVTLLNVGAAPVTFLANLAQDGVVFYKLADAYDGSQRILASFFGSLQEEEPLVSFKQLAQRDVQAKRPPSSFASPTQTEDSAATNQHPTSASVSTNSQQPPIDANSQPQPQLRSVEPHSFPEQTATEEDLQNLLAAVIAAARTPQRRRKSSFFWSAK
ncbi:hypothetical protein Efla_002716 [Eimeria flavescens]